MRLKNRYRQIIYRICTVAVLVSFSTTLFGCSGGATDNINVSSVDISSSTSEKRENTTVVLKPEAPGINVLGNEDVSIDYSNCSEGYIVLTYTGSSEKVKFQLTGDNGVTYTYNIPTNEETVIPLSAGSGHYLMTLFESISGNQYATNYTGDFDADISNEFGPYLYPNQYVSFNENTKAVVKAKEVVEGVSCDLEAVSKVYEFVINNVTYDKEEAETVESSYLPDVDEVLETGKGICFDYAALMAAMLRSQGIPTRLEIGYAKDAYHAWISVYTVDEGWIGGVIQFNGVNWTLMDPTLASNTKDIGKIKDFIGDGSSYTIKYMY